ncbi:glycosyltransferase family 25 protein [Flavobacteriales bacterium]|nr:glycosyltransferase family 25 protein [Flavobacteriales bacterium]
MRAYCVNIETEKERRKHCEKQYQMAEIDCEFVPAIDGRIEEVVRPPAQSNLESTRWHAIDHAALSLGFFNRGMSSPEKACALSHFRAWERAAAQSDRDGLHHMINEDDFKVGDLNHFSKTLDAIAQSDFDIVYLGYRGGESPQRPLLFRAQQTWHRVKFLLSDGSLTALLRRNFTVHRTPRKTRFPELMQAGMTWGGHAYLINRRGADALMECNRNLRFLPDEALRWVILEGKVKVGMSTTKHFVCEDFGSAIRSLQEHEEHHQIFPST